jgi:hypothetical protein
MYPILPGVARLARLAQVLEAALRSASTASVADDGDFMFHVGFLGIYVILYCQRWDNNRMLRIFPVCSCCGDVVEIFLRLYGLYGVISTSSSKDE